MKKPITICKTNLNFTIMASEISWAKHHSLEDHTLIHSHFELAGYRGRKSDGMCLDIYGWVNQITVGGNKGKYTAGHPTLLDQETGSDAVEIGVFDVLEQAKKAVEDANPPQFGTYC